MEELITFLMAVFLVIFFFLIRVGVWVLLIYLIYLGLDWIGVIDSLVEAFK